MNALILEKTKNDSFLYPHVYCWMEGYNNKWSIITSDSWHVLFKNHKPKRLRKRK